MASEPATTPNDDPIRTMTYMRGYRNGLVQASKMLDETRASVLLSCGEMTAQELRSVMAVLAWKRRTISAYADEEWERVMGNLK